jgi:hypothetical protein
MAMEIDISELAKINSIIEHDRTDATYKYALLRAVVDTCQKNRNLVITNAIDDYPEKSCEEINCGEINCEGSNCEGSNCEGSNCGEINCDEVTIPIGILIEKWIFYYYPLIESETFIPQKRGEPDGKHALLFRPQFEKLIEYYRSRGGFSAFYRDYTTGTIPDEIFPEFLSLVKDIRKTIADQPMKYLGRSYSSEYYSVFTPQRPLPAIKAEHAKDRSKLVRSGGYFTMSAGLAAVFEYFGAFISGEEGLLKKWASFSSAQDKSGLVNEAMIIEVLTVSPETERAVSEAKSTYTSLFENGYKPECVWSGKRIHDTESMAVDHMIPFSVWKNNDLWNLLPALNSVNSKKSDKIPSPALIEKRSDAITGYWEILHENYPVRFEKEISVSLMRNSGSDRMEDAVISLVKTCQYLTEIRGFEAFNG